MKKEIVICERCGNELIKGVYFTIGIHKFKNIIKTGNADWSIVDVRCSIGKDEFEEIKEYCPKCAKEVSKELQDIIK